jgi:hypothetical protein
MKKFLVTLILGLNLFSVVSYADGPAFPEASRRWHAFWSSVAEKTIGLPAARCMLADMGLGTQDVLTGFSNSRELTAKDKAACAEFTRARTIAPTQDKELSAPTPNAGQNTSTAKPVEIRRGS